MRSVVYLKIFKNNFQLFKQKKIFMNALKGVVDPEKNEKNNW